MDLWVVDALRLHWSASHPRFVESLEHYLREGEDVAFAEVEEGLFLLAWLPHGVERACQRFPRLRWHSTLDADAVRRVARRGSAE